MNKPTYSHHVDPLPADIRFDVIAEHLAKPVQIAFGGPESDSPHAEGSPFKRVQNIVTGRTAIFRLDEAAVASPNVASLAFERTKAHDYEKRNAARRTRK